MPLGLPFLFLFISSVLPRMPSEFYFGATFSMHKTFTFQQWRLSELLKQLFIIWLKLSVAVRLWFSTMVSKNTEFQWCWRIIYPRFGWAWESPKAYGHPMTRIAMLTAIPRPIPEYIIRRLMILIILTNQYAEASTKCSNATSSTTFFTSTCASSETTDNC